MWRCEGAKVICEDVKQTPTIRRFRRTLRSDALGKTCKTHHAWSTFGSWHVEKNERRSGAQHISKSKRTKHTNAGALLEVAMSKKWTPLWREAPFQVKMRKAHHSRTTFRSWDVEKVHEIVARSTFPSQKVKSTTHVRTTFQSSDVVLRGRRKGFCTLPKVRKTWGFCACPKTMAGGGTGRGSGKMQFHVAAAVQETCSSEMLQ